MARQLKNRESEKEVFALENLFLNRAKQLEEEIRWNRRAVHSYAEVGLDLPQTTALVAEKLRSFGLDPQPCGPGIVALVGKPAGAGKAFLLRADMDALPMREVTGLPFAADNGNCHSCGHDCHTAMLLGAAKLLKEREAELEGTVKLMFQPGEEQLAGAKAMVEAGVLEGPKVDAAMAIHLSVGLPDSHTGAVQYVRGTAANSGDMVRITVKGFGTHGSTPQLGVDAISVAAHIVVALEEVIAREISTTEGSVMIVGKIEGGDTCNTVSGHCVMEASIRATTHERRAFLKKRIKEVSEGTAQVYRAEAEVEFVSGMPPLVNDVPTCDELASYCAKVVPEEKVQAVPPSSGTEDFTYVAQYVPSCYLNLGAGSIDEGHQCSMHNPGMVPEESVLPTGAALYAQCALDWLKAHK